MGGIVGVDAKWGPVVDFDPPVNNNYKPYMTDILSRWKGKVLKESGSIPINGSKIVYWLREQPDRCRKVRKFLSLGSYVSGRFCGLPIE